MAPAGSENTSAFCTRAAPAIANAARNALTRMIMGCLLCPYVAPMPRTLPGAIHFLTCPGRVWKMRALRCEETMQHRGKANFRPDRRICGEDGARSDKGGC